MRKRLLDITEYTEKHGRDAACKHFGISRESLKRNLREAKSANKLPIDEDKKTLLDRISERYSTKELKALVDDSFRPKSKESTYNFDGESVKIGVMSDLHIGSQYTNESRIISALDEMKKQGVKLVMMAGDITEGMSGRDGHVYELTHIGYQAQLKAAIDIFSKYTNSMQFKMISGNHDLWYAQKANMGALIVKNICDSLPNCEYLGEHEGFIYINGAKIMLWHGMDGASYALSYRIQKIIENMTGGEKPAILLSGHVHKSMYAFIRNIHAFESGCLQDQTPFMRGKKIPAHRGFWILEPTIKDATVIRMKQEFIPFYV